MTRRRANGCDRSNGPLYKENYLEAFTVVGDGTEPSDPRSSRGGEEAGQRSVVPGGPCKERNADRPEKPRAEAATVSARTREERRRMKLSNLIKVLHLLERPLNFPVILELIVVLVAGEDDAAGAVPVPNHQQHQRIFSGSREEEKKKYRKPTRAMSRRLTSIGSLSCSGSTIIFTLRSAKRSISLNREVNAHAHAHRRNGMHGGDEEREKMARGTSSAAWGSAH